MGSCRASIKKGGLVSIKQTEDRIMSDLISLQKENELLRKKLAIVLRAYDKIVGHLEQIEITTKYMKEARSDVQRLNGNK